MTWIKCTTLVLWGIIVVWLGFSACGQGAASVKVTALFCDHMTDPIAIDHRTPSLRWKIAGDQRGARQSAFHILVSRTPATLKRNIGDLWDSGKVPTDSLTGIRYQGLPLASGDVCWWKVRIWDEQDKPAGWSQPATWEVGLLDSCDWQARWIGQGPADESAGPLFRRTFTIVKPVARARLRIYGLGWYELYINGARVGDQVLAPPNSRYDRVLLYDTFDVTGRLRHGENALGVMLGGGYDSTYSKWGWKWEKSKRFLLQMQIEFSDGSSQQVCSDEAWKTTDGPIRSCGIYAGETYDARMEKPGWCTAEYTDDDWLPVLVTTGPAGRLHANTMPPIRVMETLNPAAIEEPIAGVQVVDMGQNFAGWARIALRGSRGDSVTLRYSELVDSTGLIDPWTNRLAAATDIYVFKGDGEEVYEPRFTYHGFRYVQVTGVRTPLTAKTIQGRVVHADLGELGDFSSSDPLLNRVYENFRWSLRSNFMSIPTDCPARDERTPCAMDSRVVEEGALYLFSLNRYYLKWLRDIAGGSGQPDWDGDQVLLAWRLYHWYGDKDILEEQWPNMRRYVDSVRARTPDLICRKGFGDWCAPNAGTWESYFSNVAVVNTALFQQCSRVVADAAGILGDQAAAQRYGALADSIRNAYNAAFFHPDKNYYGDGTQTEDVLPLAFGLVPAPRERAVADHLAATIREENGGHLDTGITGTRYIGDVLCDYGHADLALAVLTQRSYPGFGHQISLGATTTWEQWYSKGGMNSHNHAMFSGPLATLFSRFGGIQPSAPGFRRFAVNPSISDSLSWVQVSVETVLGRAACSWRKTDEGLILEVTVPPGSEAEVAVPASSVERVFEGGVPAFRAKGVRPIGRRQERELFIVAGGRYVFRAAYD